MADDAETKMRIQYALKERDARVAGHVIEGERSILDMCEEQSPAFHEAMIEFGKELQKPGGRAPQHRKKLRDAFIEYAQENLIEARRRERELFHGLTGLPVTDEDDK
jgi:hypothetical protein